MHNLASDNKHSHGVEGSETEDTSTTVLHRSVFGRFSIYRSLEYIIVTMFLVRE